MLHRSNNQHGINALLLKRYPVTADLGGARRKGGFRLPYRSIAHPTLWLPAIKASVSVVILFAIMLHIDRAFLLTELHQITFRTFIVLLAILGVQTSIVASLRLSLILSVLDKPLPFLKMWKVTVSGFFVEQVAIGFVAGDATRLWQLHRSKLPMNKAVLAIATDRWLGLCALLILASPGLTQTIRLVKVSHAIILGFIACGFLLIGIAALLGFRFFKSHQYFPEFRTAARGAICNRRFQRGTLVVFVMGLLTHLTNVYAFFLIGGDLGLHLGINQWLLIVPPALLLAMFPITAGGWGLREASLIAGLAPFGIKPEIAVIPSLVFGLSVLLVTLPGGIVLLGSLGRWKTSALSSGSNGAVRSVPTESRCAGASNAGSDEHVGDVRDR